MMRLCWCESLCSFCMSAGLMGLSQGQTKSLKHSVPTRLHMIGNLQLGRRT